MIDPANIRSIRLAQRSGLVEFGTADDRGSPSTLFDRFRWENG